MPPLDLEYSISKPTPPPSRPNHCLFSAFPNLLYFLISCILDASIPGALYTREGLLLPEWVNSWRANLPRSVPFICKATSPYHIFSMRLSHYRPIVFCPSHPRSSHQTRWNRVLSIPQSSITLFKLANPGPVHPAYSTLPVPSNESHNKALVHTFPSFPLPVDQPWLFLVCPPTLSPWCGIPSPLGSVINYLSNGHGLLICWPHYTFKTLPKQAMTLMGTNGISLSQAFMSYEILYSKE